MKEHVTPGGSRVLRPQDEHPAETSPARRRRRVQLRHEAAVVVAEIRRMRRVGQAGTGDTSPPRLAL